MIGIELVKDQSTKEPLDVQIVNQVIGLCKQKGLLIGKNGATVAGFNNVLTIAPPLNIEETDVAFIVEKVEAALGEVVESKV